MSDQADTDAEHSALPGITFACPWLSLGSRGSFCVPKVLSTPCREAGRPRNSPYFLKVPTRLLRKKVIPRSAVLPHLYIIAFERKVLSVSTTMVGQLAHLLFRLY